MARITKSKKSVQRDSENEYGSDSDAHNDNDSVEMSDHEIVTPNDKKHNKRRKIAAVSSSEDENELHDGDATTTNDINHSEDELHDPYDADLYLLNDEVDRTRLDSMTAVEREQIFYERSLQREAIKERRLAIEKAERNSRQSSVPTARSKRTTGRNKGTSSDKKAALADLLSHRKNQSVNKYSDEDGM